MDVLNAEVDWYAAQQDGISAEDVLLDAGGEAAGTAASDAAVVGVAQAKEDIEKKKLAVDEAREAYTKASSLLTSEHFIQIAVLPYQDAETESNK